MRWSWGLVTVLAACGDTPVEPDPAPAGVEPVTYQFARFAVEDFARLAPAAVESLVARADREFDRVASVLEGFDPPELPLTLRIADGEGIPFVTLGANRLTQWSERLRPEYFTHQLTHLFTRYRRSNFIEEGLAVWVSVQLQRPGELPDPYRAQPPDAWVALFQEHGSAISLFTALRADNLGHDYQGSSADASAWQLFLQAGSFTGWLIAEFGRDRWRVFYDTGILANAVGSDTPTIEQAWLADVTARHPDPLACEEALGGTLDGRETFWCARARGK